MGFRGFAFTLAQHMPDRRVFTDNQHRTCNNWTIQQGFFNQAWIGAWRSLMRFNGAALWHPGIRSTTHCCSQQAHRVSAGGAGLFYCFAVNW